MPKQLIKNITSIICLILICVPLIIVCARYDGLFFLLYLMFWVMMPGYLFLFTLKKHKLECKTKSLAFIYAFLLGSSSLFVEFFILHLFGFINLINYINPIISLIFAILLFNNYKTGKVKFLQQKQILLFIPEQLPFLFVWLIATYLCAFSLNFFMPEMPNITYVDYTWQIGNINQLASSTPFEDIRVAGIDFKYHYFNALFFSIEKIIFDISAWIIFIQHQIFIIPLLISLTFYNLFFNLTTNKNGAALFSIFAFSGFAISHHYSDFGFMFNWSSNMNAVGLTTVASCALFFGIKPLLHKDITFIKSTVIQIAFCMLLLLCLSGFKGPYGAIFLTAIVCFMIMRLFKKIKPTKAILTLLVLGGLLFFIMYNLLLSSGASTYLSYNILGGILSSVTFMPFFGDIPYLPGLRFIMFIPSLILTFTLIFFPLILCAFDCIFYVFSKKELRPEIIFASFITVIGIAAFYIFDITGHVQIYFLYCAIPFAGYLALNKMLELFKNRPKLQKASIVLLICFSINGIISNFYLPKHDTTYYETINAFIGNEQKFDKQTTEEFEAYEFLKNYAQDDKLVFCTRSAHFNDTYANFYYISAFAEQPNYFEGYLYAERNLAFNGAQTRLLEREKFFSESATAKEKFLFANENNIAYIFMFNSDGYDNDLFASDDYKTYFETIFANDSVSIYEVLPN